MKLTLGRDCHHQEPPGQRGWTIVSIWQWVDWLWVNWTLRTLATQLSIVPCDEDMSGNSLLHAAHRLKCCPDMLLRSQYVWNWGIFLNSIIIYPLCCRERNACHEARRKCVMIQTHRSTFTTGENPLLYLWLYRRGAMSYSPIINWVGFMAYF